MVSAFWSRQIFGMTMDKFVINIVLAAALVVIGVGLGKLVKFLLKKAMEKAKIEKAVKYGFVELLLVVIKWAIYIIFINLALIQLGIPELTEWLTGILVLFPALVGALLLIAIGFAIATYLKEVIEDSRIEGWKVLNKIVYFFVIYVFLVFAFRTALIFPLGKDTVNLLLVILSGILAAGIAYWYSKQK